MKKSFYIFLVFSSIIFTENEIDIPQAQLDLSSLFQNTSKSLKQGSAFQSIPSVLDNYSYLLQAVSVAERKCQEQYHMSMQQKHRLLSHGYADIVEKLLTQKYLTDQQIWSLWEEYKNKRWWDWNNEKIYTENDLKDALEKRMQQRKKQEQVDEKRKTNELKKIEYQELLQKYDSKILSNLDYVSSNKNCREQALTQTITDGGKKYIKIHDIDVQTKAFMQMQGIDHRLFENLSGTIFAHQLFQESADHYKKAAKCVFEYGLKNSVIIPHLLEFAKAAFVGTQHEQFALAITLSDIAEILAESSLRICKGVIESTCDFIDIFRRPEELAKSLCLAMRFLGGSLAAYDQEGVIGVSSLAACQKAFDGDLVIFNQICNVSREHFNQWCKTSSEQDKVQVASKLFADAFITPIVVAKTMKACGGILLQAQETVSFVRTIELAEELGLGFVETEELLLATEAGVRKLPPNVVDVESSMNSLIESEIYKTKEALGSNFILSETEAFVEKQAIENQIELIMKNDIVEIKKLSELEKNITLNFEGISQNMLFDIEHIFIPEIKVHWNYDQSLNARFFKKFGLAGWHYKYLKEFESAGFIKILTKAVKNDCVYVEFLLPYSKTSIKKTFYPEYWSKKDIVEVVKKAVSNPYKIVSRVEADSCLGKTLYSQLDNGIEIISYLRRDSIEHIWDIKSSFISKDWILK